MAAIYNGSDISVYVEGKELVTTTEAGTVNTSDYPFGIGYCPQTGRRSSNYIKELHLYNTALTEEELNAGEMQPTDENVVVWYDFDEYTYGVFEE